MLHFFFDFEKNVAFCIFPVERACIQHICSFLDQTKTLDFETARSLFFLNNYRGENTGKVTISAFLFRWLGVTFALARRWQILLTSEIGGWVERGKRKNVLYRRNKNNPENHTGNDFFLIKINLSLAGSWTQFVLSRIQRQITFNIHLPKAHYNFPYRKIYTHFITAAQKKRTGFIFLYRKSDKIFASAPMFLKTASGKSSFPFFPSKKTRFPASAEIFSAPLSFFLFGQRQLVFSRGGGSVFQKRERKETKTKYFPQIYRKCSCLAKLCFQPC